MKIPTTVVVAILVIFVGLLCAVVLVGLIRNNVDTQGLAILLVPVIVGLLVGSGVKFGGGGGGSDGESK